MTLNFGGLSTVAMVGDTGSGKSSVLEAITYLALWETSRGAKVL